MDVDVKMEEAEADVKMEDAEEGTKGKGVCQEESTGREEAIELSDDDDDDDDDEL